MLASFFLFSLSLARKYDCPKLLRIFNSQCQWVCTRIGHNLMCAFLWIGHHVLSNKTHTHTRKNRTAAWNSKHIRIYHWANSKIPNNKSAVADLPINGWQTAFQFRRQ